MKIGGFEMHLLTDGTFRLDGGAMFGIVPRPLWSRERPPDERGRILLACNCPLIRAGREVILVDCGMGRKWNEKQRDIYAVGAGPTLMDELAGAGVRPDQVTTVVNTHLHLDHAGWNTREDAPGRFVPTFPNARHVIERRELLQATHPNELTRGTYLPPNFEPLMASGQFQEFDETIEICPGVLAFRTGGHTPGHCCVTIESGGRKVLFAAELLPTVSHRRLAWMMAYDLSSLEMLEAKRGLFSKAAREGWLVLPDHDPDVKALRLREGDRGAYEFEKIA